MTDRTAAPELRLGLVLWVLGILGAVVITTTVLPQLLARLPLPAPLWVLSLASFVQSAILIALAVWAGVALAPGLGLRAPTLEAVVSGRAIGPAFKSQLLPGLTAGVLGGMLLFATGRQAPAALAAVQEKFVVPLVARVFYGGITEEILLRWGFMTTIVWLAWRFLQHRRGAVKPGLMWVGIAVSAFMFGAGHLPAAAALIGRLDANVVAFVIGVNTAFGLMFGYLFWRWGLEAAMLAHGLAHLVNYLATAAT